MSADFTDRTRAISFAMGRSDGVADGAGLVRNGIDPRRMSERLIQAVAADEAARQGLDAIAYAEGYGTGLAQAGEAVAPTKHPAERGACDTETPCPDCATAYGLLDAAEGAAALETT